MPLAEDTILGQLFPQRPALRVELTALGSTLDLKACA